MIQGKLCAKVAIHDQEDTNAKKKNTLFPLFLTNSKTFSIHRGAVPSRKKVSGNPTTDHYKTQPFPRAVEAKQWWQGCKYCEERL